MRRTLALLALATLSAAPAVAQQKPPPAGPASAPAKPPAESYPVSPDAVRHDGVPKGTVTKMPAWTTSKVFPGTERDWWVYVPAQYDGSTSACLAVFQDGSGPVGEKGDIRAPVVFDNLIHQKAMPVTIGVFITPGNDPVKNPPPKPGEKRATPFRPNNRSAEYDVLSDAYARFLLDEVIPELKKTYKITDDPAGRVICGSSSGGICAFTVAWERPDAFRKVVSHVGSFTAIAYRPATATSPMRPGGDLYPALVRRSPPKPLRVFLQDGKNDLDNQFGNWFLANLQMAAAINYANRTADEAPAKGGAAKGASGAKAATPDRYDLKTEWGEGSHNGKHGGAVFADTMRWMWRDYPGVTGAKATAD
ncbi:MAG: Esterase [Phycisphaerales bacterium]|nr:Esterase [Phycisphaerales bacterium]